MVYQRGADDASSDHLLVQGALLQGTPGSFVFHFGSGLSTPTEGTTYTLITSTNASAFVAKGFSFDTDSTLQGLDGVFSVDATSMYFRVTSVQP